MKLKGLEVTPGLRDGSSGDRIPFVWAEGEKGSAELLIIRNTGDLIFGVLKGRSTPPGTSAPDGSSASRPGQSSSP